MNDVRDFKEIDPGDVSLVGGKGLSLGLLTRAGLPIPPGFCVTAPTQRRLRGRTPESDPFLAGAITDAYRRLGGGPVAVRSSATAEDGAITSFAGQQETYLGIVGDAEVLAAVGRCWESLHTDRSRAYRDRQGVEDSNLAMAVVIQRLIPAEVAGVLFTRDPLDTRGGQMLVEASWGLGESVVSGRVMPDRYHIERDTGTVVERHISFKATMVRLGAADTETVAVPLHRQDLPCLDEHQLRDLAELGCRVEAYYGEPRDVEWAYSEGRFWLLQARPITAVTAAEREEARRREVAVLRESTEMGGTIWSRFNLAEVLPAPTPMTWAIVRRFMSGRGGFGLMYRDLGFDPDPALDEIGIFDLICGRPYCDLNRQLRLQFRQPPLEYPFAALKAAPEKALYPQPVPNPSRAGARFWLMLPIVTLRLSFRIARLHRTLPNQLRQKLFPAFAAECERENAVDLSKLDSRELLERLEKWIRKTLYDFARESLKPTALAGMVLESLERKVARAVGPERTAEVLGQITMGVHPDPEADLPAAMEQWMSGRMGQAEFLRRFGHRGSQEMELAQPRWSEQPPASGDRETPHLPRAARDRQALPDDGVRTDPLHARRVGPAIPAERRHLLPRARRAAAPDCRGEPLRNDRPAPARPPDCAKPRSATGDLQRRPDGDWPPHPCRGSGHVSRRAAVSRRRGGPGPGPA